MKTSKELTNLFFRDLKTFNATNFKTIERADLSKQDATVHKAFSSVITRYFIFREKHPEVTDVEHKILYFKLKLDLIANYFAEFPDVSTDNLVAFQLELKQYVKETRRNSNNQGDDIDGDSNEQESALSDIGLEPSDGVQIEQQSGLVSVAS